MAQQTRYRRQASVALNGAAAFGSKQVVTLGRGMIYREIALNLYGTVTWAAGASNAAATMNRGDEWGLIERIDVVVNGTDTIRSFTGYQLKLLNYVLYGTVGRLNPQMGDGATAAPFFDSTLIIPFWMPKSFRPMDTALDSSKLADLRLEITVASASAMNTAAACTNLSATLDVNSYESYGVSGDFSELKIYQIQNTQSGANSNVQIQMPVTALYRGFLVNFAASAAGTGADIAPYTVNTRTAIGLTNVQLVSGTTIFRDINMRSGKDWQDQRTMNRRQLIQNAAATAPVTGGFTNIGRSTLLNEEAWTFIDLCQDGYLGEGIDTVGFSEFYLNCNIGAAGTITVLPLQVYPARK